MTETVTYLTVCEHASLVALLDARRLIEANRLRSKRLPRRSRMTLAEKLAEDQKFKDELAEVNRQIADLTNRAAAQKER